MLPVNYDPQQRINRTFSNEVFMEKSLVEKIGAVLKSTLYVLFVLIMLCAIFLLVLSTAIDSRNMAPFGEQKDPETYADWTARIERGVNLGKIFTDETKNDPEDKKRGDVCIYIYKKEYQSSQETVEIGTEAQKETCRNRIKLIIECDPSKSTTEPDQACLGILDVVESGCQ